MHNNNFMCFRCRNHKCVSKTVLCDGVDNCGDNSDELQFVCDSLHKCQPNQFQCETERTCISQKFRCDGKPNCADQSDELNCKTSLCSFGTCSQICIEKKGKSFHCKCAPGYVKDVSKNGTCRAQGKFKVCIKN